MQIKLKKKDHGYTRLQGLIRSVANYMREEINVQYVL